MEPDPYLLSATDASALTREERNLLNAPNRRVMVFFFERGTEIRQGEWPCAKWNAGVARCREALWPDGDERRKTRGEAREYRVDRRTMACRFYDRFARRSPCEGRMMPIFRIRLFDEFGTPMQTAAYEAEFDGITKTGTAVNSFAVIRNIAAPTVVRMRWGRVSEATRGFEYEMDVFVDMRDPDREERGRRMLSNLGYSTAPTLDDNVRDFQRDYGLAITGRLDDAYDELTRRHNLALARSE